jgi:AcrR family transcriptional regulator
MATTRKLLTRDSFATLTLARVASEAGVSKGLLTYYFGSKEALIIETIRQYHAEQRALLHGLIALPLPVAAKLRMMVDATLPSQLSVQEELEFQVEVWSFAKNRPEARDAVAESYRDFRDATEALLDEGIAEGTVVVEDKAWTYRVLHALIDGLSFQLAVDPTVDMAQLRADTLRLFQRLLGADAASNGR